MAETLTVHVNRDGINSVAAPAAVESGDSLTVVLRNHGEPAHVHLRLGGDLAGVASLGGTNRYVDGARQIVELSVAGDAQWPVTGTIEAVTGHGQQRAGVEVTLTGPEAEESDDERADEPEPASDAAEPAEPTVTARRPGGGGVLERWGSTLRATVPLVLLAALAVVLAYVAVEVGGESAILGVLAVAAGIAVAGYFVVRG